jgi:hypothetical protein
MTRWEDDFHDRNERAAKEILKFVRMNGHKVDDPNDGTIVRNTIYKFFYGPERKMMGLLSDVDFHLDEFGIGVSSVPPRKGAKISKVPGAVDRAISTYIKLLMTVRMQKKQLREVLLNFKLEHANKRHTLPVMLHALVENTLKATEGNEYQPTPADKKRRAALKKGRSK